MATDNTQVTTYLPDDILSYVEEYCQRHNLTRKKDNKPLLATGIVELLKIVATIPIDNLPSNLPSNLPDVKAIIEKKLNDSTLLSNLIDKVLSNHELKSKLQNALIPSQFAFDDTLPVTYLHHQTDSDNNISPQPEKVKGNLPVPYIIKDKLGILTALELSVRFGYPQSSKGSAVSRIVKKGKEEFIQWTQEKDPDRLSWWLVDENDKKKGYQIIK